VRRSDSGRRLHLLPVLFGTIAIALCAFADANAHIVYGTKTLSQLTAESDVVARARIVRADDVLVLENPSRRRPVVVVELLEVIRGAAEPGPLRFAQHGHGVADYVDGEEVLLFLVRSDRHRELADLAGPDGVAFVSLQEHDAKFPLTAETRAAILTAARSYARVETLGDPAERHAAMRQATFAQLASGDARLAAAAIRDLVLAVNPPLLSAADLPRLEPMLASAATPIGVRVALLAELERRALVDAPPRWVALLRGTSGRDRRAVIAAAGAHPSPPVQAVLIELLAGGDGEAAEAAAVALGFAGNTAAVAPLRKALAEGEPRLRMASIRGLGRIGTPGAREVLEQAAEAHADADTRRRARAEATLLARTAPKD
jgi:hypothetical protein